MSEYVLFYSYHFKYNTKSIHLNSSFHVWEIFKAVGKMLLFYRDKAISQILNVQDFSRAGCWTQSSDMQCVFWLSPTNF